MFEIIEASTEAHYQAAALLFQEYAESLDFTLHFQNFDDELKILHEMYGPPKGALFLVLQQGEYAGVAGLRNIEVPTTCEVKRMFIKPALQGKGVGKALLARLIEKARELAYTKIKLDTLAPRMPAAVHLYKSAGFVETNPYNYNPYEGVLYFEKAL